MMLKMTLLRERLDQYEKLMRLDKPIGTLLLLGFAVIWPVLPLGGGRDLDKARKHFERSIEIAGPDYLLNRVTFAEFYARYAFDQELFERTLRQVVAAKPDVSEFTLMNAVAQRRAEALLGQMDDLF